MLLNITEVKFKDEVQTCQASRLCHESHDFTTISRSHELVTDFSCFQKVKLEKTFGAVGFVSELDIDRWPA